MYHLNVQSSKNVCTYIELHCVMDDCCKYGCRQRYGENIALWMAVFTYCTSCGNDIPSYIMLRMTVEGTDVSANTELYFAMVGSCEYGCLWQILSYIVLHVTSMRMDAFRNTELYCLLYNCCKYGYLCKYLTTLVLTDVWKYGRLDLSLTFRGKYLKL